MSKKKRIILAITGASGSVYARLLAEKLALSTEVGEIAVIVTDNGQAVMQFEDSDEWLNDPRFTRFDNHDLFSAPASGSAKFDALVIVPASMGMLGRIASGVSNDLISRAADVMLKERRKLIVVARETPLNAIHLQNMLTVTRAGGIICPASPSFYAKPESIQDLCNTVIERVISLLQIDLPGYEWGK